MDAIERDDQRFSTSTSYREAHFDVKFMHIFHKNAFNTIF